MLLYGYPATEHWSAADKAHCLGRAVVVGHFPRLLVGQRRIVAPQLRRALARVFGAEQVDAGVECRLECSFHGPMLLYSVCALGTLQL